MSEASVPSSPWPIKPGLVNKDGFQALALVLLTVLAYASALGNGFVSDDLASILGGRAIDSLRNLPQVFLHDTMWNSVGDAFAQASTVDTYRPLPMVAFFIEHALYGHRAIGYHLDSVLLHALNVILVWRLGRLLALSPSAGFLAAAVFATHPSICEAVHWINGRSDPMAILCLLSAVLLALPWVRGAKPGVARVLGIGFLVLCATLCKEIAFVMAPACAVLAMSLTRSEGRRMGIRSALAAAAPWLAGLGLGFAARTLALGRLATGSGANFSYGLVRVPLLWRDGLVSLLVPSATIRASLFAHYREVHALALSLSILLSLALIILTAWVFTKRRLVLLPWFVSVLLVTLAPTSLLTSFEGWAGWGRYLYPAAPTFVLAFAELGMQVMNGRRFPRWLPLVLGAIPMLLAAQTFAAGADFRDERAYNMAQIRDDPESEIGYLQLGSLERFLGRPQQAIPLLTKAVGINPRSKNGWSLLAWCYLAVGDMDKAFRAAQATRDLDPPDRVARFVESVVLIQRSQQEEAAGVLLPLLAEDSGAAGLWAEAAKASLRFGQDSPFNDALRKAMADDRSRPIRSRLEALLSPPAHR
jgi:protein O-mannosyl-transferase